MTGVISTEVEKSSLKRMGRSLHSGYASGRDDSEATRVWQFTQTINLKISN